MEGKPTDPEHPIEETPTVGAHEEFESLDARIKALAPEIALLTEKLKVLLALENKTPEQKLKESEITSAIVSAIGFAMIVGSMTLDRGMGVYIQMITAPLGLALATLGLSIPQMPPYSDSEKIQLSKEVLGEKIHEFENAVASARRLTEEALIASGATRGPDGTLAVAGEQVEVARAEMNSDLAQREREEISARNAMQRHFSGE